LSQADDLLLRGAQSIRKLALSLRGGLHVACGRKLARLAVPGRGLCGAELSPQLWWKGGESSRHRLRNIHNGNTFPAQNYTKHIYIYRNKLDGVDNLI
jgi:hypothetical protein